MQSSAATVDEYLRSLPADRQADMAALRDWVREHLPEGLEEGMQYGMIGYFVPHTIYPAGYHCDPRQPLPFLHIASQKNYMSLYMMCLYQEAATAQAFRDAWAATGKKLDMGKSCIRFRRLADLAWDVLEQALSNVNVSDYIANYERGVGRMSNNGRGQAGSATTSVASKPSAASKSKVRAATPPRSKGLKSSSDSPPPRQSSTKKSSTKKSSAKKTSTKKSTAKKSTAKKSTAKKSTAKKSTAKKSTAKKSAVTKSAVKKSGPKKKVPQKGSAQQRALRKKTAQKKTAQKKTAQSKRAQSKRG